MTSMPEAETSESEVAVLSWTVPRPTGRWHQSFVVTSHHVWVLPEVTFAENEKMLAAAAGGVSSFHDYLRASRAPTPPPHCDLTSVRGVSWNETTGWVRVGGAEDEVIGAMIPNRDRGSDVQLLLKQAIRARIPRAN